MIDYFTECDEKMRLKFGYIRIQKHNICIPFIHLPFNRSFLVTAINTHECKLNGHPHSNFNMKSADNTTIFARSLVIVITTRGGRLLFTRMDERMPGGVRQKSLLYTL